MGGDDGLATMGGLSRTATFESVRIRAAVEAQARKVARLAERRRKMRRAARQLDAAILQERRFLRAMIRDLGGE